MMNKLKNIIYSEKYHDNCLDYLKKFYIERYANKKYQSFLYQIKKEIPKVNICTEMKRELYVDTIVCDQHAVIFSYSTDIYPVIATYALNACVGLVMYIPEYKVASLAHIDGLPGYSQQSANNDGLKINFSPVYDNISKILNLLCEIIEFGSGSKSGSKSGLETEKIIQIEYYLIGGIFELSEVMVHDIVECINSLSNDKYQFRFVGRNILGPANQARNISFDTRDGSIYYFDFIENSEVYQHHRKNKLPVNIIKAPRESEAMLDITYLPIKI